jgi:hypothetical protein
MLKDVAAFLAVNPREIVTLLVEGGVPADLLQSAMSDAGLDVSAWSIGEDHDAGDGGTWPTLEAMIDGGHRVVLLADVTGATPAWMLPLWTYVKETGRTFSSTASMTCDITRGPSTAPLFLMNEFLVDGEGGAPGPEGGPALAAGCDDPALSQVANAEPFFMSHVSLCTQVVGTMATFVSVDDFEEGDLFGVVHTATQ